MIRVARIASLRNQRTPRPFLNFRLTTKQPTNYAVEPDTDSASDLSDYYYHAVTNIHKARYTDNAVQYLVSFQTTRNRRFPMTHWILRLKSLLHISICQVQEGKDDRSRYICWAGVLTLSRLLPTGGPTGCLLRRFPRFFRILLVIFLWGRGGTLCLSPGFRIYILFGTKLLLFFRASNRMLLLFLGFPSHVGEVYIAGYARTVYYNAWFSGWEEIVEGYGTISKGYFTASAYDFTIFQDNGHGCRP